jgi:xanthine dehydrogenase YagS FAD-binding subunit
MKNFELVMPSTVAEAIAVLPKVATEPQSAQKVRILAGGQDLLPEMKDYLAQPDTVVNIKGIDALATGLGWSEDAGAFRIGALTTVARLAADPAAATSLAVLSEAAASIASPQVRSLATVAGNLCQRPRCWYYRNEHTVCLKKGGDECFSYSGLNKYNAILGGGPSYIVHPSDLAPALVCLDATLDLHGPADRGGRRSISVEDFFLLPDAGDPTRENVLAPNELIEAVVVPGTAAEHARWKSTYVKFRERDGFDFAVSSVALRVRMEAGKIAEARLCLGGVAPTPWRCKSTEALLVGKKIDAALCTAAGDEALKGAEPLEQNGYKIPLTKALITKALQKLA